MRRFNISRLPVINSNEQLVGIINSLDRAKIMTAPKERISANSRISSQKPAVKLNESKGHNEKNCNKSVRIGTKLGDIVENFREHDEIVVVGDNKKPVGIVTARDALEILLPRRDYPSIKIANVSDHETRRMILRVYGKIPKENSWKT